MCICVHICLALFSVTGCVSLLVSMVMFMFLKKNVVSVVKNGYGLYL